MCSVRRRYGPDVHLADAEVVVAEIVDRLDGLPLAIELAAAKVRVMGVADIARRLENRFALLRGGDRSAPDRHQTLLAVIDWSWNLLAERERRALRWLSAFHDGFSLAGAEVILGDDALAAVQDLADQSLLTVVESAAGGVRYRMLETVREFGRMQLVDAGEDDAAEHAHRAWAMAFAAGNALALFGPGQFDAVDAVRAEENNLSDALRRALATADPAGTVQILSALAGYWVIRGEHLRLMVLLEAVANALAGWIPSPDLTDATRMAVGLTLNGAIIANSDHADTLRAMLRDLGPGDRDSWISALVTMFSGVDPRSAEGFIEQLRVHAESPNRQIALVALPWLSQALENMGDPVGAMDAAERGLRIADETDGPWVQALTHTMAAQLAMQLGRVEEAVAHTRAALPVLDRLGARDDSIQLRSLLALAMINDGELDAAADQLAGLGRPDVADAILGGWLLSELGAAELALARGDTATGLDDYRAICTRFGARQMPGMPATGLELGALLSEATALAAHAYYASTDDPTGTTLFAQARDRALRVLDPAHPYLDYPVCGMVLFALGAWGLLRDVSMRSDAVRLIVLAERFAYNRSTPTMSWERISAEADRRAPGLMAEFAAEYGQRRGPELLDEARGLLAGLRAGG